MVHVHGTSTYVCNKDTMSQSLPQPGGMTQECALIIRIMNGTCTSIHVPTCNKVTMSQSLPQPGGMTQECALIIRIMNGTCTSTYTCTYMYVTGHHVTKLAPTWWNDPRMCTHNKDNEWYMYIYPTCTYM